MGGVHPEHSSHTLSDEENQDCKGQDTVEGVEAFPGCWARPPLNRTIC